MLVGIDASRANEMARTGTEWYSYHLIQELKKLDQENQYTLYSKGSLRDDLGQMPPGWNNKVLNWPPRKLWTQFRLSWEMLWHAPDVLFIPAHIIPPLHPRRTVTTCHDVGFERYPQLYSGKELRYHRWSMRRAVRTATRIITVSEFTKQEMISVYNVDPDKVDVVYNSFDQKVYRVISDQHSLMQKRQLYGLRKPYFLCIGRLEHKKNTPFLIESFSRFNRAHDFAYDLVLAGVPGYGYDVVRKKIQKHDPDRRWIRELGYVSDPDLPFLLNMAEAFLFPSLYEGFGIPVLEAMGCGVPVICSRIASLPEVALHSALFFDPRNEESFIAALESFMNEPDLRFDLKRKGLERVKVFSWERCARQTLHILQRVARFVQ